MVAIHPVHQPGAPIDLLARCPDLLIVSILETLPKHDLCSVSRLNKRYHALADAVLYNTVQWLKPELHLIFSQSLSRRPRRGSAIEEVKLAYPASEITRLISDTLEPMSSVSQTISTMSNLKTLDIAVPVGLLHSIGNLFNGPFDLACLQSCTLFYQDEDDQYWDLQENIHIFTHPTLETLVIKRAKLDDRGFEPIERPRLSSCTHFSSPPEITHNIWLTAKHDYAMSRCMTREVWTATATSPLGNCRPRRRQPCERKVHYYSSQSLRL